MKNCKFCNNKLEHVFVDLGVQPPSNYYVKGENLNKMEAFFPLVARVCQKCFLVQLDDYQSSSELFDSEYAYFSSYSSSWLEHCKQYVDKITADLSLNNNSFVVEIASNDGYLLQYFKQKSIPHLGIEPTLSTGKVAIENGIETIIDFFGTDLAKKLSHELPKKPDLIIGNNVLAHVPDINNFVQGLKVFLAENGTANFEFPHLLNLIKDHQFDTIYHEHFSYFSLYAVEKIFAFHGLDIYDVEEVKTHGGSLRIYACHTGAKSKKSSVEALLKKEIDFGITDIKTYINFEESVKVIKRDLLKNLIEIKNSGKKIIAYGAAAKGNTFLNYCGIRTDFIDYVVDKNPTKQNKYLPGSHIPILSPEKISQTKPDYVFILPWNLSDEIVKEYSYIRQWGGKFISAIPHYKVL